MELDKKDYTSASPLGKLFICLNFFQDKKED